MPHTRLQELCTLLVQNECGQDATHIFTTLADRGRLTRLQLQRSTSLNHGQLRTALTLLIKRRLLLYSSPDDQSFVYQANWRGAYNLARADHLAKIISRRHGSIAAGIMSDMSQMGVLSVRGLSRNYGLDKNGKNDSVLDDQGGQMELDGLVESDKRSLGGPTTTEELHGTLCDLLMSTFLAKAVPRDYTPAADLEMEAQDIVINQQFPDGKITGTRRKREFDSAVNTLKRKWLKEKDFSEQHDIEFGGVHEHPSKRQRVNGLHTNGDRTGLSVGSSGQVGRRLPEKLEVQINYARCTAAMRTQRLRALTEDLIGIETASVYEALLHVLESKVKVRDSEIRIGPTLVDDEDDDDDDLDRTGASQAVATTVDVFTLLESSPRLRRGIKGFASSKDSLNGNGVHPKKKGKMVYPDEDHRTLGIKVEQFSDDEEDEHTMNGIDSFDVRSKRLNQLNDHLKLLEEHPRGFCRRVGNAGHGEWKVDFSALSLGLVELTIDNTILDRFGRLHSRVIHILRERGKLDEKQIAAWCIMRIKDVRTILTELLYAGFVEAQEVPRDALRQSNRTFYLYFHDTRRVQDHLLQQTYQAMSRSIQRLQAEKQKFKSLLEKVDMMDDRTETLKSSEQEALQQWTDIEEKFLTQIRRLDDDVAVLRDFQGGDTSMIR